MVEEYELEDGSCPHCGSDDINHVPSDWQCRKCGGGRYDTPPDIRELIRDYDLTPPEAVDWIMVVCRQLSRSEWADERDRDVSTVSENVSKAGAKIYR